MKFQLNWVKKGREIEEMGNERTSECTKECTVRDFRYEKWQESKTSFGFCLSQKHRSSEGSQHSYQHIYILKKIDCRY